MGIRLDSDTEFGRRSSIPSGTAGTLSDGGFKNCFTGVWLYRDSAGQTYATTSEGSIIHYQAGARECKIGFDNTFGAGTASDPLLQVLFNSGGGAGSVQTFVGANFLNEWVYYFFFEDGTNQVAGYIRLSDLNTAVTITRANDNAGSQYINTLTFGNASAGGFTAGGTYAYARARYEVGITIDDVKTWAASTVPIGGDWGFWPLANNTDSADDSGNARDLTFSAGLDNGSDPVIAPPPSVGFDIELRDNGVGTFDIAIGSPNVTVGLTGVSSTCQVGTPVVFVPSFQEAMLKIGASVSAGTAGSNTTTTSGITTVSGEPIVIGVVTQETGSVTVTDSYGNSWTEITPRLDGDPDATIFAFYVRRYYCANPTGGSGHTFTATITNGFPTLFVQQLIDVDVTTPLAVHTGQADASSPFTSGTVDTTGDANCILVGIIGTNAAGVITFTANNGFTIRSQQTDGLNDWTGALVTRIVSEADLYEASVGINIAGEGVSWIGAFRQRDVGTDPITGAHTYVGQEDGSGANPAVTPAIQTQVSGSSFITAHAGYVNNNSAPTDTYSNTWTSAGTVVYTGYSGVFDVRMYYVEQGSGGNDHTVSFTKPGTPTGEATVPFIEVRNAGRLEDFVQNYPAAGAPLTSGSVTTTGPAVLVAFWWGDTPGLTHTAVPNNGFNVIEAFGDLPPGSAVQMFVATKEVTAAGTYDVTWTETPDQGAVLWLYAFELQAGGVVSLTGTVSTSSVGSVGSTRTVPATGTSATGQTGSSVASRTVALSGNSSTGQTGSVASSRTISLSGVSSSGQVGSIASSKSVPIIGNLSTGQIGSVTENLAHTLTGVAGTGQIGTVAQSTTVALTGNTSTGQTGSVTPSVGVTIALTGVSSTGQTGSVGSSRTVAVTGTSSTGQVGSVVGAHAQALTGVQGAGQVGSVVYGEIYAVTGVSSTGQTGTASPSAAKALTGVAGTGQVGTAVSSRTVALTGTSATGQTGTVAASSDGSVGLSGNSSAGSPGTLGSNRTVSLTGTSATGQTGTVTWGETYAVTGNSSSGQVGSVTALATYEQTIAGVQLSGSAGNLLASRTIALTGVSSTGQIGTVGAESDGQISITTVSATGQTGTISSSRTVALTGTSSALQIGTVSPRTSRQGTGVSSAGQVGSIAGISVSVGLTGAVGNGQTGTVGPARTVGFSGVQATHQIGGLTGAPLVPLVGVSGSLSAGTLGKSSETELSGVEAAEQTGELVGNSTVSITGVSVEGRVGEIFAVPEGSVFAPISGVQTSAAVASPGVNIVVGLTGVSATGQTGSVVSAKIKSLTGVSGTGSVGNATFGKFAALTGVSATGLINTRFGVSALYSPKSTDRITAVFPNQMVATGTAGLPIHDAIGVTPQNFSVVASLVNTLLATTPSIVTGSGESVTATLGAPINQGAVQISEEESAELSVVTVPDMLVRVSEG